MFSSETLMFCLGLLVGSGTTIVSIVLYTLTYITKPDDGTPIENRKSKPSLPPPYPKR